MKEIIAGKNESGQRLDKLLRKYLPEAGTGFIYKMIRKKNITLNDHKCSGNEIISEGDSIKLWLSDDTVSKFQSSQASYSDNEKYMQKVLNASRGLQLIYEDEDIVIYNKPAGMLSQKSEPEDISVNDILLMHYPPTETFTPSICNRLDRNTSGLIICGKTLSGLQHMAEHLRNRTVHKDYLAVVDGRLLKAVSIRSVIDGKELHSEVRPLAVKNDCTYVCVRLFTGKTHQIRKHMSSIGHPVTGDRRYGNADGAKRQLLHAYRLTLPDGKIIEAPIPEDFKWELGKPGDFEDLPLRI